MGLKNFLVNFFKGTENNERKTETTKENNDTKIINLLTNEANQGDKNAQYKLGNYYDSGLKIEQNYDEAFKWYKKAAEQGHIDAQYNLGIYYKNGYGIEQNYDEAFKWLEKATEQGHIDAQSELEETQYYLGLYYEQKGNYLEAFKWFEKIAEKGHRNAQYHLGLLYFVGKLCLSIWNVKKW